MEKQRWIRTVSSEKGRKTTLSALLSKTPFSLDQSFGNLGIGIWLSASRPTLASALRKCYFCHTIFLIFFWKKKTNYFFLCLVILHYHHFAINTYFSTISYSSRAGHCWYRKKGAWIFGSTHPLVFQKFWKLPSKTSIAESFLIALADLPRSFPKRC